MSSNTPVKSVPTRSLGKGGPRVSAMGFGLAVLSGFYGTPPNDEERFQVLDRAVALGYTFWDTSDVYGDNEELLGKWFRRTGKREEVFLASKFGIALGQTISVNSTAEYCKRACDASLRKLGVDSIDLYYAHRLNPETPVEETMRAMAELKAEGKIKHIGLSEVGSATLRRACKIAPVAAVQMEYSPFVLDIERESGTHLLKTCRELGVAIVCYCPLGRGLLTGSLTTRESFSGANDARATHYPRFSEENFEANSRLVSRFKALADKKGITPAQLALAWLLNQGDDIIPIPGTKRIKNLEQNWSSLDVVLSAEEETEIRSFVESAEPSGARESHAGKTLSHVETVAEA